MSLTVTYVILPTYREPTKVAQLLVCFAAVRDEALRILIINGNPGDETSRRLAQLSDPRVTEIAGHPGLFWSGLVNLGLRRVLQSETENDFIVIMNADVEFDGDILTPLIAKARQTGKCQLAAATVCDRCVVSSGVKVASWMLTINRHPLAGSLPEDLPADALIPVDFLPTRCTLIPYAAVQKAGLVAESSLPHYGADNEYTDRLRKLGYQPYIYTGVRVRVDTGHTGADVFRRRLSVGKRLRSLFSIKSTANPIYRLRFVRLVYPWYAWPTAMLLYVARSAMEVILGGAVVRNLWRRSESGFAGY